MHSPFPAPKRLPHHFASFAKGWELALRHPVAPLRQNHYPNHLVILSEAKDLCICLSPHRRGCPTISRLLRKGGNLRFTIQSSSSTKRPQPPRHPESPRLSSRAEGSRVHLIHPKISALSASSAVNTLVLSLLFSALTDKSYSTSSRTESSLAHVPIRKSTLPPVPRPCQIHHAARCRTCANPNTT